MLAQVETEAREVAAKFGNPRRTVIIRTEVRIATLAPSSHPYPDQPTSSCAALRLFVAHSVLDSTLCARAPTQAAGAAGDGSDAAQPSVAAKPVLVYGSAKGFLQQLPAVDPSTEQASTVARASTKGEAAGTPPLSSRARHQPPPHSSRVVLPSAAFAQS